MRSMRTSRVRSRPTFSISSDSSSNSLRRRCTSCPRMKTRWRSGSIWMPPASSTALPTGWAVSRRSDPAPPPPPPTVTGRGPAQDGAHPGHQLAEPVGLGHVVVSAHLEADHRVDLRPLGGDHDDRHRRPGPDGAAHVDPREPGQHEVEQHQVGIDRGEEPEGLVAVAGHGHIEALAGEPDDQRVDERLVVLGQEPLGLRFVGQRPRRLLLAHAEYSGGLGRTRVKVEPSPSRESTSTRPWWLLATWRTMESPRPVPPESRLRPWSTR